LTRGSGRRSMGLLDRLLGNTTSAQTASMSYVVLDVETTGLSPNDDRILEIALVRLAPNGAPIDEWTTRLDPEGPVGATHIHGITQADVDGKPLFRSLASQLAELLGGLPVVAHNATFDLAFLRNEFDRAGWDMPWLSSFCTLDGSYDYFPSLDRRRLADCCWAAGVHQEQAHSALGDARATAGLFAQYLARDPQLGRRVSPVDSAAWPAGPSRDPAEWMPHVQQARPTRYTTARPVSPPLVRQLSTLTLTEVIDEGAPLGSLAYLETLLAALEDGALSATESQQLAALSYAYELTDLDVATIHQAFVLALAHRALDDGHVSRSEREELHQFASIIGVPGEVVVAAIARADSTRSNRMSAGLSALPEDWAHGEPLRVGDKVVFTGCDDAQRTRLEQKAEGLGVRIVGGVSRQTAMLVTDGGFEGTKAARAAELSIRVVHPDVFDVMLAHLQPARPPVQPIAVAADNARVRSPAALEPRTEASTQLGARGASPSVVRAWAMANGIEVGVRGRLHADVFDAYWLAQSANGDSAAV
jgi:DNA polymerase-3 subunit epsilon